MFGWLSDSSREKNWKKVKKKYQNFWEKIDDNKNKELFGLLANMSDWWTATWKRRIPRPGEIHQEEAIPQNHNVNLSQYGTSCGSQVLEEWIIRQSGYPSGDSGKMEATWKRGIPRPSQKHQDPGGSNCSIPQKQDTWETQNFDEAPQC